MMDMHLTRSLRISTVVHVVVVALLLICPLIFTGFRKARPAIPVEFTVAVPQSAPEPWVKPSPPARAMAQPDPDEVVVQREQAESRARPRTVKPPPAVQRNQTKVTRYETVQPAVTAQPVKPLSQSEIRRLLAMGAKPGAQTVVPGAEVRSFETIRRALYNAWVQPAADEAGNAVVEAEIQLGADGVVVGWRLVKRSGAGDMDASVVRALQAVKQIRELTPAFIERHPTVTIAFRVEQ